MPKQELTECNDCGHTYDKSEHENCPNCTLIDLRDND